jgi:uncharacterized protein YbbC (DUF1343 family)
MKVQLGCERLFADPDVNRLIRGRRVGLVTNHSGVDSQLRATADRLHETDAGLVLLFGPEHGIRGDAEDGVAVDTITDPRTGVPAVSLYGERRQPSPAELDQLDILLFDIQDVGVRFYTYLYTMSLAMEACAEAGIPFVVLDRPNPIDGLTVEGNLLEAPAFASFVGLYPIPIRYGLTIGELARLFHREFAIDAELHVVDMQGWRRSMTWDQTGLPWVPPSPNMPTVDTARVYPGMCLFEGTTVSEGRGTTRPFEQIGAPFLDGFALADQLNALALPGALFRPVSFRPAFSKHVETQCRGVHVHVTQPQSFLPVRTGLHALQAVRRAGADAFAWRTNRDGIHNFDKLAGTDRLRQRLDAEADVDDLLAEWSRERQDFEERRRDYLQYPE